MGDGTCSICGNFGKLSFEHIPPRAAFNDQRRFEADIQSLLSDKWAPGASTKGRYKQGGVGKDSLCEKCNNSMGTWYGASYVDFARQAMRLVSVSNGNMSLAYPYRIRPLRVLKQIVAMFFSACGPDLQKKHSALVRFLLNRELREFPRSIRIYGYLHHPNLSTAIRRSGITGIVVGNKSHVISEIAFPPFGFVMSLDGEPIEPNLVDLSYFAQSEFKDRETVYLQLPVLPVVSWLPGDFRTREEMEKERLENKKRGSMLLT
jgi:hypothetical protein